MFLRFRRDTPSRRGQALVETALILPILILLLVLAIDFGRVFFGWVALQNAARVGADFAAGTADAWKGTPAGEQAKRDRYFEVLEADLRTINCTIAGGTPPDPTFRDGLDSGPDDDGNYNDGDYAVVDLECSFDLITPLADSLVGGSVNLLAHEEFPINRLIKVGVPAPPVLPECPTPGEVEMPELEGLTMEDALERWIDEGFAEEDFAPEVRSTGNPALRNNTKIVTLQTPDEHDCVLPSQDVVVRHTP
jgi:hypothetical protein